jgi:hypothetical protein
MASNTSQSRGLTEQGPMAFVGRQRELALLRDAVSGGGVVVSVHGPAGIGKSALLTRFARALSDASIPHVLLDGRTIEPSIFGFQSALAAGLRQPINDLATLRSVLHDRGPLTLIVDGYDRLWLLDQWICTEFTAALPMHVSLVIGSRRALGRNWRFECVRCAALHLLPLGPLVQQEAITLLTQRGVADADALMLSRDAGGHPLTLTLIGAVARLGGNRLRAAAANVVQELAALFLEEIDDRTVRHGVEAAACVRRVTVGLLRTMVPDADAERLFRTMQQLPLFESGENGLVLHDGARGAIASALRAADPERAASYERAAWRHVRAGAASAPSGQLWQFCADMIFLLRHPAVRSAFFPADTQPASPEPARDADRDQIRSIVQRYDGRTAADTASAWMARDLAAFRVVRDADGLVEAFYWAVDPFRMDARIYAQDPVAAAWWTDLRQRDGARGGTAIFMRRHLCREHGEGYCPAQAACWLDIKRLYMEMRPTLRWVYTGHRDFEQHLDAMRPLGFAPIPELRKTVDGIAFHTLLLDMGPGSFDAWLTGVVAAELGGADDRLLDPGAREVVIDSRRIPLTRNEFGVMSLLHARAGQAVTRDELLDEVWGAAWDGSSNVVEAVVKSLRRKLDDRADCIRTVRGIGYLYRAQSE